jgi:hypothetical protein
MAITLSIKLIIGEGGFIPLHKSTYSDQSKLVDALRNYLGLDWYVGFEPKYVVDKENGREFGYLKNKYAVFVNDASRKGSHSDENTYLSELRSASDASEPSFGDLFVSSLFQVINPFKWMRHGVTFAILAAAIGIGISLWAPNVLTAAMPALTGIFAIGLPVGVLIFVVYGVVDLVREYRAANRKIQALTEGDPKFTYSFGTYLRDLLFKWRIPHPFQATVVVVGLLLCVAALILTIPYCIDPTGSFAFMSVVLNPLIHFLHAGLSLLVTVPHLEFLKVLQTPIMELGISAGLFIASTLAIAFSLKGLMQGRDQIRESAYGEFVGEKDEPKENVDTFGQDIREQDQRVFSIGSSGKLQSDSADEDSAQELNIDAQHEYRKIVMN